MENEVSAPTMTYQELSGFEMQQVLAKIANTPTTTPKANAIRKIINLLQTERTRISEEYRTTIHEIYFQKNEDGTIKHDDKNEPILIEGKEEEYKKVTEEFGKKTFVIPAQFRPSMLTDVKQITAKELDALKALYVEEDGPGLPFHPENVRENVSQLRQ